MRIIGLCGRSGSGKSVFTAQAEACGIKVFDCDKVYADMVSHPSPCLADIAAAFGENAVKDGALNRAYLAPLVFADGKKLARLNRITHKHIKNELRNILAQTGEGETVLLDAPTLFESGVDRWCDLIIGVIAPYESCAERIALRDGISAAQAEARLNSQTSENFIIENCDVILYNDSTLESFAAQSRTLAKEIAEGEI
ncbi:MAG: dephospho-CoA kinase [Clostridia bacterium]|nr:dephospho-CoA kinase [Clostridia bacterium]